jgi:hypothetical protein
VPARERDASPSALRVLETMATFAAAYGSPPSVRRVGHLLGIGVHAVHRHLLALERVGLAGRRLESAGLRHWDVTPAGHERLRHGSGTCAAPRWPWIVDAPEERASCEAFG